MSPQCVADMSVQRGKARAHGHMLFVLTETLIQTHFHPHMMAIIQNDTFFFLKKGAHWLH